MKFKIKKIPKNIQRRKRRKWHEAFAWGPQRVDCNDEGHSIVWFEKYMRQERVGPTNKPDHDGTYWRQYSMKEYFKRKLNGDFDVDRNLQESDGETQADTRTVGSAGLTGPNKILMKSGQFDNNKYKRCVIGGDEIAPDVTTGTYVVGGADKDIKLYDENGGES